jgi:hypothetical protein
MADWRRWLCGFLMLDGWERVGERVARGRKRMIKVGNWKWDGGMETELYKGLRNGERIMTPSW